MAIEESILEAMRALPPDRQQEVLDFADSLRASPAEKPRRRRMRGLCADLGVSISEEDIAEARREMWKNFPRDDI